MLFTFINNTNFKQSKVVEDINNRKKKIMLNYLEDSESS